MAASMYFVIAAVLVSALQTSYALTDEKKAELKERLRPTLVACGEEFGFTLDQMKAFKEQKKRPDDSNKCFFACVFKKIGLMDSKGLYSEKVAVEKLTYYAEPSQLDKVQESAKACNSVNEQTVSDGEAGCDRAKLLFECIVEQKEQFGLAL